MKTTPIFDAGISGHKIGHKVDFTLQDLLVLGGLQNQLIEGAKRFGNANAVRLKQNMTTLDTIEIPSQILTQCLTIINKIVGDIQNLDDAYNELFDIKTEEPRNYGPAIH